MNATQSLTFACPHCKSQVEVMPRSGHELVTCPACNKPFQATVPEGVAAQGQTMPNDMPAAASDDGPMATPESREGRANIAEQTEQEEDFIRTVSLNMFRRYPLRCLVYCAMIAGGVILALIFHAERGPVLALVMASLSVFGAYRLFTWWLRMRNTKLTITSQRCILESGIFTTEAVEIPLKDIASISVGQNILTSLLNVGDLTFTTSGAERRSLIVMAVPDPGGVVTLIRGQGIGAESVRH